MSDRALLRLGRSTAEAVVGVLASFCDGNAELGDVAMVPDGTNPLMMVPAPAVVADVAYVDGVTGGNLFAISLAGARSLACGMMGDIEFHAPAAGLSELEMSAVGEAMNQMMVAAAAATSQILRQDVEIDAPCTRLLHSHTEAFDKERSGQMISASITVHGQPARLVQVVPEAFLARIRQALDEGVDEAAPRSARGGTPVREALDRVPDDSLRPVRLRVWAEIGRTRMPMARAVAIQPGAVVELDRDADEPVDLYVNGRRFATGRLLQVDETDWAVRIESLADNPTNAEPVIGRR